MSDFFRKEAFNSSFRRFQPIYQSSLCKAPPPLDRTTRVISTHKPDRKVPGSWIHCITTTLHLSPVRFAIDGNTFFSSFRVFCLSVILFLPGLSAAQEQCNAEVKLLLSPANIPATVEALTAEKESSGNVYFFDTEDRDLLAQGVIVRLRRGTSRDLTVKLRPLQRKNFANPSSGRGDFKCEVDRTADEVNLSYSLRENFTGAQIPATGNDIYRAFSKGQRTLLSVAHVIIDWNKVKLVAEITVTDWKIKLDSPSRQFTLELWKWPGGIILELSRRTDYESSSAAYAELRQIALDKQLKLTTDQRSKTRIALLSSPPSVTH